MSASDCDCSLDWLASGGEDKGSLFELDCEQAAVRRATPPPTSPKESWCWPSESRRHSGGGAKEGGRGSLPGSTRAPGAQGHGPMVPGREGQSVPPSPPHSGARQGEKAQQTRKRHIGSVVHKEQEGEEERDKLFAYKCSELQCYIPPLSSILSGLRSGRYRGRLSSFQESVAMDRIQRIMGVLQNRCTGERYISIILKVEEMLKNWFPNIKPREQRAVEPEEMIPSKKQKVGLASAAQAIPAAHAAPPGAFPPSGKVGAPSSCSATHTKWLHTGPICSSGMEPTLGRPVPANTDATQDNAVSSSTDGQAHAPPSRPHPGKINAPCLERLLKSTESIVACRSTGGLRDSGWS